MTSEQGAPVRELLDRIEQLVGSLHHVPGREAAREAVQAVLDLHGLALARVMAVVAAERDRALLDKLVADEAVRAVLLLYGLHPDDPGTRIRRALDGLQPRLAAAGLTAALARLTSGIATIRIGGARPGSDDLRREIEEAVIDAAPELEEIVLERLDELDLVAPAEPAC